jgi:hypothetical protein
MRRLMTALSHVMMSVDAMGAAHVITGVTSIRAPPIWPR